MLKERFRDIVRIMKKSTNVLRIRLAAISLTLSGIFFCPVSSYPTFLRRIILAGGYGIRFLLMGSGALSCHGGICTSSVGVARSIHPSSRNNGWKSRHTSTCFELDWDRINPAILWSRDLWLACNWTGSYQREESGPTSLINSVRLGEGVVFFIPGLLFLAAGTILFAIAIWGSSSLPTWIGIPLAIGFALYIPQFFELQSIRVAHGLLITIASILIAWSMLKRKEVVGRT